MLKYPLPPLIWSREIDHKILELVAFVGSNGSEEPIQVNPNVPPTQKDVDKAGVVNLGTPTKLC